MIDRQTCPLCTAAVSTLTVVLCACWSYLHYPACCTTGENKKRWSVASRFNVDLKRGPCVVAQCVLLSNPS